MKNVTNVTPSCELVTMIRGRTIVTLIGSVTLPFFYIISRCNCSLSGESLRSTPCPNPKHPQMFRTNFVTTTVLCPVCIFVIIIIRCVYDIHNMQPRNIGDKTKITTKYQILKITQHHKTLRQDKTATAAYYPESTFVGIRAVNWPQRHLWEYSHHSKLVLSQRTKN